jgi:hypothetical protein
MQLAIIRKIESQLFVIGLTKPFIDPESTRKKYEEKFLDSVIYKSAIKKKKEYATVLKKQQSSRKEKEYKKYGAQLIELQKKLQQLAQDEKAFRKDFYTNSPIYFEAGQNEKYISEKVANQFRKLGKNQFVSIDGKVYTDHRGKQFYRKFHGKWEQITIEKLTDEIPDDIIEKPSQEQFAEIEKQKFNDMSENEKNNYIEDLERRALESAKNYRYELEIKGNTNALELSQSYYQDEMERIKNEFRKQ